MRYSILPVLFALFLSAFSGCRSRNQDGQPVSDETKKTPLHTNTFQMAGIDSSALSYKQHIYVPIYSEIYVINAKTKCLLTATMSVRNTSRKDTMYVLHVDYYDSQGTLAKVYIEKMIQLLPLESIEFVVEYTDKEGGAGANFIVTWGATQPSLHPMFQAIMIGSTASQQGISFVTEGVPID